MRCDRCAFSMVLLLAAACGGAQTPRGSEPPVTTAASVAPQTPAPPADTEPSAEVDPPNASDAPSTPAVQEAPAKLVPPHDEQDANASRQVTYLITPEGLKITVAGVRFSVNAAAVQIASGWGVKISVVGNALDAKAHSLSSPKAGPLAFAGSVQRKGRAEPERFGDERTGDGELSIFGDDPSKFSRTWPPKGTRVLGMGDALDLQVALWGLGAERDEHRPVKQFVHVRMQVDRGKPRAVVEPPASAGAH